MKNIQVLGDSCQEALDFLDDLGKRKLRGFLHSRLIEAEYDKRGNMQTGLFEWSVSWDE